MLPRNYKFHIYNRGGAQIDFALDGANNTFTLSGRAWKFTSGALEYSSELTLFADPTSNLAANNSLEAATAIDNSSDLWLGLHALAYLLTDAALSGSVDVYYEWSTDGGTTYPSDATDFDPEEDLIYLKSVLVGGAEERRVPFEL